MINKQSLWFVTLFSLIIVLCVYYFSTDQTSITSKFSSNSESVSAEEIDNSNLSVLKVTDDEQTVNKIDELQDILLDAESTLEEKNDAYDELEVLSNRKAKESELKDIIKKEFGYDNYVKISDNQISIVVDSNNNSNEEANKIIKKVQSYFEENKYITVKFQAK